MLELQVRSLYLAVDHEVEPRGAPGSAGCRGLAPLKILSTNDAAQRGREKTVTVAHQPRQPPAYSAGRT